MVIYVALSNELNSKELEISDIKMYKNAKSRKNQHADVHMLSNLKNFEFIVFIDENLLILIFHK